MASLTAFGQSLGPVAWGLIAKYSLFCSGINLIFINDYRIFGLCPGIELVDGVEKGQY